MTESSNRDIDKAIQQEVRSERRFSLAAAIAEEGGDFLKGESPVPRLIQAKAEIKFYIAQHLSDRSGALQSVLQTRMDSDDVSISHYLSNPLKALQEVIKRIIAHPSYLHELVKEVDLQWGLMYDEHPYFQQPGQPPHPEDEYTHDSVKAQLVLLLETLDLPHE